MLYMVFFLLQVMYESIFHGHYSVIFRSNQSIHLDSTQCAPRTHSADFKNECAKPGNCAINANARLLLSSVQNEEKREQHTSNSLHVRCTTIKRLQTPKRQNRGRQSRGKQECRRSDRNVDRRLCATAGDKAETLKAAYVADRCGSQPVSVQCGYVVRVVREVWCGKQWVEA